MTFRSGKGNADGCRGNAAKEMAFAKVDSAVEQTAITVAGI